MNERSDTAVEIKNLNKNYRKIKALDDVSLDIEKGEIFGLLGPNGAGKTTLVKCMNTLLKPDKGILRVFGLNVRKDHKKIRKIVGYVPTDLIIYRHLSAMENLMLFSSLYKIGKKEALRRIEKLLKSFDMWEWRREKVKNFSSGMAQKINICRGLVHEPEILILDEPTNGLDPKSRQAVRDFIIDFNKSGKTVLLTTHIMWSVEEICSRVAIIDKGKLIALDSITSLKALRGAGKKADFQVQGLLKEDAERNFKKMIEVKSIKKDHLDKYCFTIEADSNFEAVKKDILKNFTEIRGFNLKEPSLEDVFISLTCN